MTMKQKTAARLGVKNLEYAVMSDGVRLRVLDGVDLDLFSGDIAIVAGPSGAGKSTLLWALARMHAVHTSELFLNGAPAYGIKPCVWRSRVALLPQTPRLVDGDVAGNLLLPWSFKVRNGDKPPKQTCMQDGMRELGLGDVDLSRHVSELSGGQAARVALLRTLLTQPDVILLDEPTASLDDASAGLVFKCIGDFASRGGAVLAVLHQRAPGMPHRRLRLENGKLIEEAPLT